MKSERQSLELGNILTRINFGGVKDELPASNKCVNSAMKEIGMSFKVEMNIEIKGRFPALIKRHEGVGAMIKFREPAGYERSE